MDDEALLIPYLHTMSAADYRSFLRKAAACRYWGVSRALVVALRDFLYNHADTSRLPALTHTLPWKLHTVEMAAEEIGLRGAPLVACVLSALSPNKEEHTEIAEAFGHEVYDVLQAMARADSLETKPETLRTDNFRALFVAKVGDMNTLLLLIARSVCLMQSVPSDIPTDVIERQAIEAASLFAPLAHKLGIYRLKSILEDLSLKHLEREAYYHIKEKLNATKKTRDAYIARFIAPIAALLDKEDFTCHIKGRTKSIHSIWQKMKKQHCAFEGVFDLFAIRIIIDTDFDAYARDAVAEHKREVDKCWKTFSIITNKHESNLKRLRDWLSIPKSNGYESLHITVKGPEDKWVEVQIRTSRMDDIAEHGLAAHWRYKGVKTSAGGVDEWLSQVRSALEAGNEEQLAASLSGQLVEKDVFVFTPKGDLLRLPEGATVLDFAYLIHSAVGNLCTGARIGGKSVSIRQRLESGETVEIITSSTQSPKAEWLNIVVSPHARAKIRSAIKELAAGPASLGRESLERKLRNRKIEWDESSVNQLVRRAGYKEAGEFFRAIGEQREDENALIALYQEIQHEREQPAAERALSVRSAEEFSMAPPTDTTAQGSDLVVIEGGFKGLEYEMARCCSPVFGDEIFGFQTKSGIYKIHRKDCPNAQALQTYCAHRVRKAYWTGEGNRRIPVTLHVVGVDNLGVVNNMTSIISKDERIILRDIRVSSNGGLFYGTLTLLVDDSHTLASLIKKLKIVHGVKAVSRT